MKNWKNTLLAIDNVLLLLLLLLLVLLLLLLLLLVLLLLLLVLLLQYLGCTTFISQDDCFKRTHIYTFTHIHTHICTFTHIHTHSHGYNTHDSE